MLARQTLTFIPGVHDDVHNDPLAKVLQPPKGETHADRLKRLQAQEEAQKISRNIDEYILESKKALDKRRKAIKILLLGQAESGKSTTLKNFQLTFSPNHFRNEASAWKTVIQLNLIRSIKRLLEILQEEWDSREELVTSGSSPRARSRPFSGIPLTDNHRRIKMRLSPLVCLEEELIRKLFPQGRARSHGSDGICVTAGSGWKGLLNAATGQTRGRPEPARRATRPGTTEGRNKSDPTAVLIACKDDIIALWEDYVVQQLLKKNGIRFEEMPGFFLNDVSRIATHTYEPTDDDILRARVRTLGVEEHYFVMESGPNPGADWYIYDVGGSRNQRHTWIPYFDDVQAIIFLAPLLYDQFLEEDPVINRLEDTLSLWKAVCSNPLLSNASLILFLNKIDILKQVLDAGVPLRKFVPSYGDAPNDAENVVRFFKDKFKAYHRKLSTKPRPFYIHETSVVDTKTTSAILVGVQEGILHGHLKRMDII